MTKFGVAGNSNSFFDEGHTSTFEAALWCKNRGLDIFEYSFGKGINLSDETATIIGKEFRRNDVGISVHAPYYINFANQDADMINKSIGYVINSIKKLQKFDCGERVVVHPASQGKLEREFAVSVCCDNLKILAEKMEDLNLTHNKVCLETMGKLGQIGTTEEIVKFASLADFFYPCIDFGHLNARTQGALNSEAAFERVITYMLDNLPYDKVLNMHVHFSKIMYTQKGESRHLTFADEIYGPKFEHLSAVLHKFNLNPIIICESDGTQAEDALTMKQIYLGENK